MVGARAGGGRARAVDLRIDARNDEVRPALEALQRIVDEIASWGPLEPRPRCMVRVRDVECPDPAGVRIVTRCRTVVDALTPCSAPVYACPAHRGTAATSVALKAVCHRHGARVDVIGVEVL